MNTPSPVRCIQTCFCQLSVDFTDWVRESLLCVNVGSTTQQIESDPKIENSQPLESDLSQKQGFSTAIAIRVRQISLEADLGQSISTIALNLMSMRFRTRLTEEMSEIGVTVDRVDMTARGNLSGHMHMPDFSFQTLRKRRGPSLDNLGKNNMLELSLTSGSLDIQLQSDWQWLLQYRYVLFVITSMAIHQHYNYSVPTH